MRRIRRITVEVVRRGQQLTLQRDAMSPAAAQPAVAATGPTAAASELPEACPVCGAPWLLLHEPAKGFATSALSVIHTAFASLDLHLHGAPDGRLWFCRRSFDQLCNRLKETV